jgi:hypothetical protein
VPPDQLGSTPRDFTFIQSNFLDDGWLPAAAAREKAWADRLQRIEAHGFDKPGMPHHG